MNQEQMHPENSSNDSDSDPYLNGQSDAEKLMRRHLQTPGDVITEDELKNLKITGASDGAADSVTEERDPLTDENQERPQTTSWDVVQG